MHSFLFDKQLKVVTWMTLHNLIRVHSKADFEFKPYNDDEMLLPSNDENKLGGHQWKEHRVQSWNGDERRMRSNCTTSNV